VTALSIGAHLLVILRYILPSWNTLRSDRERVICVIE